MLAGIIQANNESNEQHMLISLTIVIKKTTGHENS